jgi:uncharacterized protein (TIGR02646 family)
MKHTAKGKAPSAFEVWKQGDWTPGYNNLQNPEKAQLHLALIQEQGGVCCYCGRTVTPTDSHIEHFRPQEGWPDLALDYDNLHASCIRETKPGNPLHCGHFKGNGFDEAQHISPRDPDCEARFLFTLEGAIEPASPTDAGAQYMMGLLNLDCAFLNHRRKSVLTQVFDAAFLSTVTVDELKTLALAYRRRDESGLLGNFSHVVARYADHFVAQLGAT